MESNKKCNNYYNNSKGSQLMATNVTSNCCSSSSSHSRRISFIHELPYSCRKSLCDLLDADQSWRQLGGHYMDLNETQLTLISHALYRNCSPTNELLSKWDAKNVSVNYLFTVLKDMNHNRAMFLLKPFVNQKLVEECGLDSGLQHIDKLEIKSDTNHIQNNIGINDKVFDANQCFGGTDTEYDVSRFEPKVLNEEKILNKNINDLYSDKKSCNNNIGLENQEFKKECNVKQTENKVESRVESEFDEMEICYKELLIATDDFDNDRILGSGGFGIVYKGEWKGTNVAIKRLKGCDNISQALTELKVLNRYRIDNILPIYGVSLDGPEPCLVYQYMPNGSLEDRLLCKGNTTPLSWMKRSSIGEGIARALNYLHTLKGKPFVHGDVKSANVLLDSLFEPKLGDFGLARQVIGGNGLYTHCTVSAVHGTSVYLPFEYLRQKILSPAVDVYSYGIVLLEMSTGKRAFDGKKLLIDLVEDEVKNAEKINSRDFSRLLDKRMGNNSENNNWFDSLLELGLKCAHKSKNRRPQTIQILEFYSQCKTQDRIRRLSAEAKLKKDSISISKSNIKTPLELQLWYDMVRKSGGQQSGTVCPTVGTDNFINDVKELNTDSEIFTETDVPNDIQMSVNQMDCIDVSAPLLPLITELGFRNKDLNFE